MPCLFLLEEAGNLEGEEQSEISKKQEEKQRPVIPSKVCTVRRTCKGVET